MGLDDPRRRPRCGRPNRRRSSRCEPADSGADTSRSGVALVTNILLFLMLQTYGSWVLTAVTREKASRVIEVLLAVIRPKQLLVGKTVGIGRSPSSTPSCSSSSPS